MAEKIEPASIIAKVKVHSGGRIAIPADLRKEWDIKDGDYLLLFFSPLGEVALTPVKPSKMKIRTPRLL
ncbi:MAG: AbrB/MazE/SpoVT family DNA-binding domain-containing protein [Methermicoccaceae archaeon]